jgi:hypothetical protein
MKTASLKEHAMYRFALAVVLPLLITFLHAPLAAAATGTVTGTLYFPNNSMNWCDASGTPPKMDCTGALFPASQAGGAAQPVRESLLVVQRLLDPEGFNWESIGGAYTNASGAFNITWTASSVGEWRFLWIMEHRDGVFSVVDSNNLTYRAASASGGLPAMVHGGNTIANVSISTMNEPANIYNQAWRAWNIPLKNSVLLWANFWGVRLQWPFGVGSGAAGDGPNKVVLIRPGGWQGSLQTAHEMGHVASYVANPFKVTTMYNWPTTCVGSTTGSCPDTVTPTVSWSFNSTEHAAAAFEEGLAEFMGMGAHYWFDATGPRTCRAVTANCITIGLNDARNVEVYQEACNNQAAIAVTRFLWDTYDNVNGGDTYSDTLSRSFASAIDTLGNFPNTTGSGGENEPWNMGLSAIDDNNGRGAVDYATNSSISVSAQRTGNCTPL